MPAHWRAELLQALDAGLDLVAGLHTRLAAEPEIAQRAAERGRRLTDVRNAPGAFAPGSGAKRSGRRLLSVGTDCAVGKKYTALAIERNCGHAAWSRVPRHGPDRHLIADRGLAIDAVVSDFVSGAAEWLSPANDADHWDVIEGQGSLFHPSYAAVTLGLIHGSQPDALVLCHELGRAHIGNLPDYPIPSWQQCIEQYTTAARLTNSRARVIGISLNTAAVDEDTARLVVRAVTAEAGLPCTDPLRFGCQTLADAMASI